MAIITVSRGSYSRGKEIAEAVATRLGYECVSRDVLLQASEEFRIPEVKLVRALHDAPSVLNRIRHGREKFVAHIRTAFLEHVQRDDVVYHGLAGHFFLQGVAHVLKVRVIADIEDRVRCEMSRENTTRDEALRILEKDDQERMKWSRSLYGIDTVDSTLYDLVVHIRKLTVEDAVDVVCHVAALPQFQATDESRKALDDLLLAARVKSAIVASWPTAHVGADGGVVVVHVEGSLAAEIRISGQIQALAGSVPGVKDLRVSLRPCLISV